MREPFEHLTTVVQQHKGKVVACGLILPENLSGDALQAIGGALCSLDTLTQWAWGDWWRRGDHRHGERAALVRDVAWAGPAYSTLCNYGLVAKSFGQFSRRREKLTFTHHASVYRLPAGEADRILALAEAEHRSTRWVEDEIRTYFRDHAAPNWWDTSQQPGSQDDARTVYAVSVQAEPARPVTIPVFHRVEPARTVTLHAGQVIPDDRTVTLHARPVIRDDDAISPLTSSHTAIDQVVDAVRTALSSPQLSPQAAMAAIAATVEQSLPQATNHSLRPKLELLQQLLGGLADIVEPAA